MISDIFIDMDTFLNKWHAFMGYQLGSVICVSGMMS